MQFPGPRVLPMAMSTDFGSQMDSTLGRRRRTRRRPRGSGARAATVLRRVAGRAAVLGASALTALALTVPALGEARANEAPFFALPAPVATVDAGPRTYIVQAGDTLYAIARANNSTVDRVAALNGI